MPPAITAEQLSKTFRVKVRGPGLRGAIEALLRPRYRDVHAVREVTFRIDPGEIVAFLGPNGAGKTTTLKMLAGLLYPTSGRVEVAGFVPWSGGPEFKRRIALVLGNRQQLVWDLPPEETFQLNRAIYEIAPAAYRERLPPRSARPARRGAVGKPRRPPPPWGGGTRGRAEPFRGLGGGRCLPSPKGVRGGPGREPAATGGWLLAALPIADLSMGDPPIEEVIRQAFTHGVEEDDS